jgi:hypothetical protein
MTWGFVDSFGGVFAVMCGFAAFEYFVSRGRDAVVHQGKKDLAAALERAQAAAQATEREIAQARLTLGS